MLSGFIKIVPIVHLCFKETIAMVDNLIFLHLTSSLSRGNVTVTISDDVNDFVERNCGSGMDLTSRIFPKWIKAMLKQNTAFKKKFEAVVFSSTSPSPSITNGMFRVLQNYLIDQNKNLQTHITINTGLDTLAKLGVIAYRHIGTLNKKAEPTGKTLGYIVEIL